MNKHIIFIHNGKNPDFSQFLFSGPHEGGNILSSFVVCDVSYPVMDDFQRPILP